MNPLNPLNPLVPQQPKSVVSTPPAPTPPAPPNKEESEKQDSGISTNDLKELTQNLFLAIERKTFSKEEIVKIYPIYEKISIFCERIEKKIKIENLYKDDEETK